MIKFSVYDNKDFSMTRYNTDDFNLEVYLSVKARIAKDAFDLLGIKSNVDEIYYELLQQFKSNKSISIEFL